MDMDTEADALLHTCDSVGSSSVLSICINTVFRRNNISSNKYNNMQMRFVTGSNVTSRDNHEYGSCSSGGNCGGRDRNSCDFNTNSWISTQAVGHTRWKTSSFISFCKDLMTHPVRSATILCDSSISSFSSNSSSDKCCRNSFVNGSSSSSRSRSDGGCCGTFVRSKRSCQLVLHFSEVLACAIIVCLLLGECSASCQNETSTSNCSSSSSTLASHAQTDSNLTSNKASVSLDKKTDSRSVTLDSKTDSRSVTLDSKTDSRFVTLDSKTNSSGFRQNHSFGVTSPGQGLVLENQVVKSDQVVNSDKASSKNLTKDTVREPAYLTATNLAPTQHEEDEDDNFTKIISLVVPFVLVIILALMLCVAWKLCRKYKCCNNEACLQKCSAFCNNCMSTPYVFQVPGHVKPQLSRDSTGLTLISQHRHTSVSLAYRTTGSIVRQPQAKSNVPRKSLGTPTSGISRQGSSRSNAHGVGYAPVSRQSLVLAQSSGKNSGQPLVVKPTS